MTAVLLVISGNDPFDFRQPDQWLRWKQRFQQFRQASGLAAESAPKQISTLLYCMGPDAEDVLQTTGTVSQQRSMLPTPLSSRSLTTISGFVRISIIYERARFNTRKQQQESLENNTSWLCILSSPTVSTQENERSKLYVTVSL